MLLWVRYCLCVGFSLNLADVSRSTYHQADGPRNPMCLTRRNPMQSIYLLPSDGGILACLLVLALSRYSKMMWLSLLLLCCWPRCLSSTWKLDPPGTSFQGECQNSLFTSGIRFKPFPFIFVIHAFQCLVPRETLAVGCF